MLNSNQVSVAVVGTDKVIIGGNMKRKAVTVSHNGAAFGTVNFGRSAVDGSGQVIGYPVQNGISPLTITEAMIGPAIQLEVHAVMSAGGATFTLTEQFEG